MEGICAVVNKDYQVVALSSRRPSENFLYVEEGFEELWEDSEIMANQEWYNNNFHEIWVHPTDSKRVRRKFESGEGIEIVPNSTLFLGAPYQIFNGQIPSSVPIRLGKIINFRKVRVPNDYT